MTMERARTGQGVLASPTTPTNKAGQQNGQNKNKKQQQTNAKQAVAYNVDLFSAKTVQVKNLPMDCSDDDLVTSFSPFGQVMAVKRPAGETFGFVQFKKNVASKKAEEATDSVTVGGNTVQVVRMNLPVANPPSGNHSKQQGILQLPFSGKANKSARGENAKDSEDGPVVLPIALVENVGPDVSEDFIRDLFENNFGQVLRVNMMKDVSPHKAFVEFSKMESMQKAVEASTKSDDALKQENGDVWQVTQSLTHHKKQKNSGPKNNQSHGGRQPSAGIYVTRLGEDCTEQGLNDAFSKFGRVTDVFLIRDENKNSRNSAFVDFVDVKAATKAVEYKGFEIEGRKVDVKFKHNTLKPEGCMSVYVRNVPPATTEASITAAFRKYGDIKGVQVLKDRAVAFVHFDNADIVEKLVSIGRVQLHGEQVVVRYNTRDTKTGAKPAPKTSRENSGNSAKEAEPKPENCTKVYVSHLSTETNEENLRDAFGQFGELERIFILRELSTGVSKGVAFIDFKDSDAAERAVNSASTLRIDGRQPVVRYKVVSQPQKADGCSNTVFAANLAPETTEQSLLQHCQQYGPIESVHLLRDPVTGISRGKGFIMFRDDKSVDAAVSGSGAKIDGKVILFRCVQPAYAQNRREKPAGCVSVFVSNLSKASTIQTLANHFSKYGPVNNVSIVSSGPSSRRVAFVTFKGTESVDQAVAANGELVDGHHVVIRYGDGNDKGHRNRKNSKDSNRSKDKMEYNGNGKKNRKSSKTDTSLENSRRHSKASDSSKDRSTTTGASNDEDLHPFLKELKRLAAEKKDMENPMASDSESEAAAMKFPPGLDAMAGLPTDLAAAAAGFDMPPGLGAGMMGFPPSHPYYYASLAAAMNPAMNPYAGYGGMQMYPGFNFPQPPNNYGAAHHAFVNGNGRSGNNTPPQAMPQMDGFPQFPFPPQMFPGMGQGMPMDPMMFAAMSAGEFQIPPPPPARPEQDAKGQ